MARLSVHTPSNGAPGICVRRRKRDRERLRQRWQAQKLEEARKEELKEQADDDGAHIATPRDEGVAKGGSDTEDTTTIGSEGERETSTHAVLDTAADDKAFPSPASEAVRTEVPASSKQAEALVETSDDTTHPREEEGLGEDRPTADAEGIQENDLMTEREPHSDMLPTTEVTEDQEHTDICEPVKKSVDPIMAEAGSNNAHDPMPEAAKDLEHASDPKSDDTVGTVEVKHDIDVQNPELGDKFSQPVTNPPDEKFKPSLTPLKTSTFDNEDALPTPPLSAHEPQRRSSRVQVVISMPRRIHTPRKAQISTPVSKAEEEPRYSLRNSARKTMENIQGPVTPTTRKRKRRASSPISPSLWAESENIDGCIVPEESVSGEIIVLSSDHPEPPEATPPPKRRKSLRNSILTSSPYFTAPSTPATVLKRTPATVLKRTPKGISVRPWPSFTAESFGLVQEELHDNPFHLLIATTFLNRTRGSVARPLLEEFLSRYPTPEILSVAPQADLEGLLQPLGLYRIRAERLIKMAAEWLVNPPGSVEKVLYNYPPKDTLPFPIHGREPHGVETKLKWEIAHLPGIGAYALDSWRIFCRDSFLGGAKEGEEEWRRVVPKDKELRAYCRWRWAKEGVVWEEDGDAFVQTVGQE